MPDPSPTSEGEWGRDFPPLHLPSTPDVAALAHLAARMPDAGPDERAAAAIHDGMLKDLAACFAAPAQRAAIDNRRVVDLAEALACFEMVAAALGYAPGEKPRPGRTPPRLELRQCRIEACELPGRDLPWGMELRLCRFAGIANFEKATFRGPVIVRGSTFAAPANFGMATFEADAEFGDAPSPDGQTSVKCDFRQEAVFGFATFAASASFGGARFASEAAFWGTRFRANARFDGAAFEAEAAFGHAHFEGESVFTNARFGASAYFGSARFVAESHFNRALFHAETDFFRADFVEPLDLRDARFEGAAALGVHELRFGGSTVLGGRLHLRPEQVLPRRGGHGRILGERSAGAKELLDACDQYGALEENFAAQGSPDATEMRDWSHYRYMDLRRQIRYRRWGPYRLLDWLFMKWCFGYGVYTRRILLTGLAAILLFALAYATNGLGLGLDHWDVRSGADDARHLATGTWPGRIANGLYFSAITFTTIGYGDWHPVHWAKLAGSVEGILGVFIMSVFTVSFSRKLLR